MIIDIIIAITSIYILTFFMTILHLYHCYGIPFLIR